MRVEVLLFASLKDLAGTNRMTVMIATEQSTVKEVRDHLARKLHDDEGRLGKSVAAVNQEFAFDDDLVNDGDEVAFFPPVSGGSAGPEIVALSHSEIELDSMLRSVSLPVTGAVCIFSGIVRGETLRPGHQPRTHKLEYESYEPMALAKMRQVITEIRERWPLVQGVAVIQRVGELDAGQPTVAIACSAAHRDDGCFEAARYGIDRLKEIVPVWKKEIGVDGTNWIEGRYWPAPHDRQHGESDQARDS